ncbi:MAG: phosphoribosylformylglycinamidine synthase subunit PurQ [Pseudomonadota bacterium]
MRAVVILVPGLNRDRDMLAALELVSGHAPQTAWATDTSLPDCDLIVVPGGFSYGDYLRCGAIAARLPVMREVAAAAARGVPVLGVCNGFQILIEAGLLPGALMRNASLRFVCRQVQLQVTNADTRFTRQYELGQVISCPVAHHDGNYFAEADELAALNDRGGVAFRYANGTNPNGSVEDIAAITNVMGNVMGMMPHPENLVEPLHGGTDGRLLFESALSQVA